MLVDEVLAVGVAHHLAVHRAGLAEVVILGVLLVGVAAELAVGHVPEQIRAAVRVRLRAAKRVRRVHRLIAGVR